MATCRDACTRSGAGRDLKHLIGQSLFRNACLDASRINVTVSDGVVCLTGTATSWLQRQAAERAAYDAPSISMVDNQIVVEPPAGIEEEEELP